MKQNLLTIKSCLLGLVGAAVLGSVTGASAITIGTATGANEFPFGTSGGDYYQQIYNQADFSGPISIGQISFFLTDFLAADTWANGDYSFYLSTTTAALNSAVAYTPGANNQLFGSFVLGGAVPLGQINFNGAAFNYNPGQGNLLLTISVADQVAGQDGLVYLDAMNDDSGTLFSRYYNYGSGTAGYGLVTAFNGGSSSVPDASSALGLLSGACIALGALRRKLS
jgi:hypothetical protein